MTPVASSPFIAVGAAGLAIGAAGYGGYQLGKSLWQVGSGREAYTERPLARGELDSLYGNLAGSVVGGGLLGRAGFNQARAAGEGLVPNASPGVSPLGRLTPPRISSCPASGTQTPKAAQTQTGYRVVEDAELQDIIARGGEHSERHQVATPQRGSPESGFIPVRQKLLTRGDNGEIPADRTSRRSKPRFQSNQLLSNSERGQDNRWQIGDS